MAIRLWCADTAIDVDDSIAEMSRPRVNVKSFEVTDRPASFQIERVRGLEGLHLKTDLGHATVALEGNTLRVDIEEGPFLGELALRLGCYVVIARLGGALIHATALVHRGRALVACGKSGDGKSTLSRLSAPTASLLSDEVVALFPDGRVCGTPFRSDFDNVGGPICGAASYFVALRKADHESLEPLDGAAAFTLIAEQSFEPEAFALPRRETRRRLMQFLGAVQLGTLAFRKEPAVGPFVASLLEGRA